jgi:hypothetical protein
MRHRFAHRRITTRRGIAISDSLRKHKSNHPGRTSSHVSSYKRLQHNFHHCGTWNKTPLTVYNPIPHIPYTRKCLRLITGPSVQHPSASPLCSATVVQNGKLSGKSLKRRDGRTASAKFCREANKLANPCSLQMRLSRDVFR